MMVNAYKMSYKLNINTVELTTYMGPDNTQKN